MLMNPASERMLTHFSFGHLPAQLQTTSSACAALARQMAEELDSAESIVIAEVVVGLRKLLEAKDCFVRARLHLLSP
jgi:hypothetical protein